MNETEMMIILTDNGSKVLKYLQEHDSVYVGKDLEGLTGVKGIYPVLTSLKNKGLVKQEGTLERNFTNNKGEVSLKTYKTYCLTDLGRHFEVVLPNNDKDNNVISK